MNWLSHFQKELHTPTGFSCGHCSKPFRCCDFTPFFPNFLVGAAIAEDDLKIQSFLKMEEERLHPLGIFPPDRLKRNCDFFHKDSGKCKNWRHRPSECASYYCGSENKSYQDQSSSLFTFELYISQLALQKMGFSTNRVNAFVDDWNNWLEGEKASFQWSLGSLEKLRFYEKLWQGINQLSWEELKRQLNTNEIMSFEKHLKFV